MVNLDVTQSKLRIQIQVENGYLSVSEIVANNLSDRKEVYLRKYGNNNQPVLTYLDKHPEIRLGT